MAGEWAAKVKLLPTNKILVAASAGAAVRHSAAVAQISFFIKALPGICRHYKAGRGPAEAARFTAFTNLSTSWLPRGKVRFALQHEVRRIVRVAAPVARSLLLLKSSQSGSQGGSECQARFLHSA